MRFQASIRIKLGGFDRVFRKKESRINLKNCELHKNRDKSIYKFRWNRFLMARDEILSDSYSANIDWHCRG